MSAYNEHSRLSRIQEHNIYTNTDNLYNPLRNALRKSTVSQNYLSPPPIGSENRLSASRVARNMRSLSPAEVETIKRNIFIPVNKELVPTRNLQKVLGKRFVAVDMEERVGEALSPEEFNRVRSQAVEEIVYEMKDGWEKPAASIYTVRNGAEPARMQSSQFTNPSQISHFSQLNNPSQMGQTPQVNFSTVNNSTQRGQSLPMQTRTPPAPIQLIQSVQPTQPHLQSFQSSQSIQNRLSQQQPSIKDHPQEPRQDLYTSLSSRELKTAQPTTATQRNDNFTSRVGGSLVGETPSKFYDFRQSNVGSEPSILRSKKSGKEEYKYNLFSMMDEAGNNGCKNGCFGSNEFIASRIGSKAWN